ncbi:hypothetical protein [Pseudidiomarina salinarum]|uniref:hypothetical protein n=1 Tax=Pseudidiomarina salinarum TaxID=435908 RepID=UPI000690DFB7|nr:hypothetical protein [Pseudidiomarina salinarum]RUO71404.1 hypothetical protein CWI79_08240 [Pseudidiomarina salinarum]
MSDQAAGLREWAAKRTDNVEGEQLPATTSKSVVVLGLPGAAQPQTELASQVFVRWAEAGKKWVGDPASWHIIAASPDYDNLSELAQIHARWAIWIADDINGFYRAYEALKAVAAAGPRRVIALHPPIASRQGLLGNLQQVARNYLGIDLILFKG